MDVQPVAKRLVKITSRHFHALTGEILGMRILQTKLTEFLLSMQMVAFAARARARSEEKVWCHKLVNAADR